MKYIDTFSEIGAEREAPGVILNRRSAMDILMDAPNVAVGVDMISALYAGYENEAMVVTIRFRDQPIGFTHIMVEGGCLRLLYHGLDDENKPRYEARSIEFVPTSDIPFRSAGLAHLLRLAGGESE